MILTCFPILMFRRLANLVCMLIFCAAWNVAQAVDVSGTPSAFAVFKEQAELGDQEAQYNIAVMLETGWSVSVDNKRAVRWFLAAAKQGHAKAQLRLGMMYYLGVGSAQSSIKGEKWIRKAAKQGQPLAEKLNQHLFDDALPDTLKPAAAISQVRKAYLQDEQSAVPVLNNLLRNAKQQAQREEKAKQQTTIRERRAQRSVDGPLKPGFAQSGAETMAESKEVVRVNSQVPAFFGEASVEEKRTLARGSIATIRLQADAGLASAQYNLARMYELGIKLPLDKKRALEWYEKSAQQGYADAEYRLGIAYFYGVAVKRDEIKGKKWLALAARHGHSVAKDLMAEFENDSSAVQKGVSLAVRWYLERAATGDGQAAFHLGKVYEYGWGVQKNLRESLKWYQQASRAGVKQASELVESVQVKISKRVGEEEPGQLGLLLDQTGLPVWLAKPVVLLSFFVVLFTPVCVRWWRKRRQKILLIEDKRSELRDMK